MDATGGRPESYRFLAAGSSYTLQAHPLLQILNPNTHYEAFELIRHHLTTQSVIALTRVCRQLSGLYRYLLPKEWSIDRHLSRYVKDPNRLRSEMAQSNALISGHVATQFFERVVWQNSVLEIFVQNSSSEGSNLISYLEDEGYTKVSSRATGFNGVSHARMFTRRNHSQNVVDTVRLCLTSNTPICSVLLAQPLTAGANVISWNKAYAIFPLPSFIHHKGYLLGAVDDKSRPAIAEWSHQGWKVQDILWPEEILRRTPVRTCRRIGDTFTWQIDLPINGIACTPSVPDFVLEHCQFQMYLCSHEQSGLDYYKIHANAFKTNVLKYEYTYGTPQSVRFDKHTGSWRNTVLSRSNQLALLELQLLDPNDRPNNYLEILWVLKRKDGSKSIVSPMPLPLTYRDEEIPSWYRNWEKGAFHGSSPRVASAFSDLTSIAA